MFAPCSYTIIVVPFILFNLFQIRWLVLLVCATGMDFRGEKERRKQSGLKNNRFPKLNNDKGIGLPVSSHHRMMTDKIGLVIFGIVMIVLIPFLAYTLSKSDIRRLNQPYDSCGDFCGENNENIDGVNCSGKDLREKPFLSYNIWNNDFICSKKNMSYFFVNTDSSNKTKIISQYLLNYDFEEWDKFLITTLITGALCTLIMILFRFVPGLIVWGVIILGVILLFVISYLFWFASVYNEYKPSYTYPAIFFTVFTFVIIFILYALYKKIQLIKLLYGETAKAIFGIPFVLCLPVITFLIQFALVALLVLSLSYMFTAGVPVSYGDDRYKFELNDAMVFTIIFTCIVAAWGLEFLAGCQYMITAGSVAHWFFKKKTSRCIILTSTINTLKFHLGTIVIGSVIVMIINIIKFLLKSIGKLKYCCCGACTCCTPTTCSPCCCDCQTVINIIKYLSKNAYIETAIRGKPFVASGKRAVTLLFKNAVSMIALNYVGDFILAITQFVLIAISTGIAYLFFMDKPYLTFISFVINIIIVFVLFSTFQTTVDTLFICFCEDKLCSNGVSKPYRMPKNLMKFVNDSQKLYNEKH
nr:PREDICTED: choline transporter-like protein 1 isoform X2 [Tribolium castaneum]|eukprot:XP_015840944.1 PREDICTED: choline transporter-like protein 1 isoform X2 [Tribolium castaneum]